MPIFEHFPDTKGEGIEYTLEPELQDTLSTGELEDGYEIELNVKTGELAIRHVIAPASAFLEKPSRPSSILACPHDQPRF